MAEMREPELVRGLKQGQPAAWHALHDAYAERVWRVVARLLGASSTDVADVVQETFLAAARSARNYDSARGSLWSWLWGITRLQAALHFRKQAQADRLHRAASAIQKNGELRGRLAEAVASPSAALEQ